MGFPLARSVVYRYRDDFLNARDGSPEPYNHWFRRNADGTIQRAHDGNDIWARRGLHVVAPFSGTVMDPATRWRPWRSDRYGRVVAIQSDEPTSVGYVAILAHLDSTRVQIGDHVERGQVIGILGTTGNAEGGPAHIHFELRAPFMIHFRELGTVRDVDAFDPYPSLRAADPKVAHA